MRHFLGGNHNLVADFLKAHLPEVKMHLPEATYLLWLDFRAWDMKQNDLKKFMVEQAGLGLNDGLTFGSEGRGFMRLNVASPRALIQQALEQLKAARET